MIKENVDVTKNKAIYFVLPMLQLNKSSFGADNFITCYLDKSGYIVVNTKNEVNEVILNHEEYVTDYVKDGTTMVVFNIPEIHKNDAQLFIDGKYSELSAKLKIQITKIPQISKNITSMLNPQPADKQALADKLGVRVSDIKEISSIPGDSNFVSIK